MKITVVISAPAWITALLMSVSVSAQYGKPPEDWPCVQRYVPKLSAGVFWPGELPDTDLQQHDAALDELAEKTSNPFSPLENDLTQVKNFLDGYEGDKHQAAARLVAALSTVTNRKRDRIIKGIERFSQRQKMMLRRMENQSADIEQAESQAGREAELEDLETRQKWDIRVFEEREAMLNNLCEQPVLLEQRFFALGRHIASLYSERKE